MGNSIRIIVDAILIILSVAILISVIKEVL